MLQHTPGGPHEAFHWLGFRPRVALDYGACGRRCHNIPDHKPDFQSGGVANNTDTDLVNSWGLAQSAGGPLWVADNGSGLSTVYDNKTGEKQSLTVTIPNGAPTGIVYVPTNDSGPVFPITANGVTEQKRIHLCDGKTAESMAGIQTSI